MSGNEVTGDRNNSDGKDAIVGKIRRGRIQKFLIRFLGGIAIILVLAIFVIAFELRDALVIVRVGAGCLVRTSSHARRTGLIAVACCKEVPWRISRAP